MAYKRIDRENDAVMTLVGVFLFRARDFQKTSPAIDVKICQKCLKPHIETTHLELVGWFMFDQLNGIFLTNFFFPRPKMG